MVGNLKKSRRIQIMALRINTNVAALNAHRQLLGTETRLNSSMQKLSSGYRINTAGDDASGLVQANAMRANIRSLNVAAQNTIQGKANLAIAEGDANTIEGILERMKELCVKGGGATTQAEMDTLIEEIDRIADSSQASTGTIQVGVDATTASQITTTVSAMGASDLSVATVTADATGIATVDAAIAQIGGILGDIGATMNRLEYTYANLQTQIENLSASESAIRDVDMAAEMVNFTKNQILLQAGTAMLSQANMSTQNVLSLFG
ncbi:MAG TPA: flagellin FliC [Deltaproteobacteria bacterium]|nr:flagellin FliC [Deltaproteobacteria bacterium]